jgi:aminoglycoside phosphotransferase (APT) family kinase protein
VTNDVDAVRRLPPPRLVAADAPLIAREFGLGVDVVLVGPVARGEVGQVWRLETAEGPYAVKEPFDAPDGSASEDEATFQELGIAAGVPAPRIVRTTTGRVLASVHGTAIRLYEWVDLRPPDRRLDPPVVAAAVARLHRVHDTGRNPVHPWYTDPVGQDEWRSLVGDLTASGAPFADHFRARLDELIALERLIERPSRVQTCHRDLFADNVLPTGDGGLCVIDWENSGLADPSQELAVVLFEFAGGDARRAAELYGVYRDAGGPGVVDRPASFSMAVAQLGHIGHHAARSWLADSRPDQRERNAGRVEEFLTDAITLPLIEELLDAVGG